MICPRPRKQHNFLGTEVGEGRHVAFAVRGASFTWLLSVDTQQSLVIPTSTDDASKCRARVEILQLKLGRNSACQLLCSKASIGEDLDCRDEPGLQYGRLLKGHLSSY